MMGKILIKSENGIYEMSANASVIELQHCLFKTVQVLKSRGVFDDTDCKVLANLITESEEKQKKRKEAADKFFANFPDFDELLRETFGRDEHE